MAQKIVIDTSILIDYFRKTDKENSVWIKLIRAGHTFAVSVVTIYEVYSGATDQQQLFWNIVMKEIEVIPLDGPCIDAALQMNSDLKKKRKQIDMADLFIAATAYSNGLSLATLNMKHFERIDELNIVPHPF